MMDLKKISENLNKLKYPAIILLVGIMLMLMPTGTKKSEGGKAGNTDFAELLSSIEGVGEARVLISESGVVKMLPRFMTPFPSRQQGVTVPSLRIAMWLRSP